MKASVVSVLALSLAAMIMTSGCSMLQLSNSKDEIRRERIYASGNKEAIRLLNSGVSEDTAIRAVALSDGGVGIGVDVGNLQAIGKHPFMQLGAAVVDAGLLYGAYWGVTQMSDSSNHETSQTAGRDNNTTTINGNGNVVNNGDQTTTTGMQ